MTSVRMAVVCQSSFDRQEDSGGRASRSRALAILSLDLRPELQSSSHRRKQPAEYQRKANESQQETLQAELQTTALAHMRKKQPEHEYPTSEVQYRETPMDCRAQLQILALGLDTAGRRRLQPFAVEPTVQISQHEQKEQHGDAYGCATSPATPLLIETRGGKRDRPRLGRIQGLTHTFSRKGTCIAGQGTDRAQATGIPWKSEPCPRESTIDIDVRAGHKTPRHGRQ